MEYEDIYNVYFLSCEDKKMEEDKQSYKIWAIRINKDNTHNGLGGP